MLGTVRDTSYISERCQGATRLRREVPVARFQFSRSVNDERCAVSSALSDRGRRGQPTWLVETMRMTADGLQLTAYGPGRDETGSSKVR